jgi:two-component system CheB/CheR fusion protein
MSTNMITKPSHIVAIGASAGGLEELNAFFDHTPTDGVSYVIVQHLSTSFKSKMVELLAKHSKLTINEARDDMPVNVNEVYLIPSDKYLTITDNRFHLSDKTDAHPPHLTIDKFFESLARNSGQKAIAVILSGLGSDVTEGLKAIKEAGGIAIARNPETTEFASMPSNAIATGLVDFILEPEFMPRTIEEYIKHGPDLLARTPDEEVYMEKIFN